MAQETSDFVERARSMEQIINELKARVLALETRLAAAEQQLGQKWFQ